MSQIKLEAQHFYKISDILDSAFNLEIQDNVIYVIIPQETILHSTEIKRIREVLNARSFCINTMRGMTFLGFFRRSKQ